MDLAFLRHPERFRRWQRWSWKHLLRRLTTVDRVMCISRFTADEVIRIVGLPASRVDVTYLGCEFHPDEPAPAEQKPDLPVPDEFFLFVGSLEPGKNLALLKEVYAMACAKGVVLPPLVILGARWEGVVNEGKPPADWHYLGRQPDAVLVYLYRRALALCFPSKYEGFGLPLVEAMALECPVICSPVGSLPEVGGDAAVFTELDPKAYLKAMRQIAGEEKFRSEVKARGLAQARKFSWRQCAEATAAIYRQVQGGG
jgi:alpha-1,3-rhamnosyl/mannosyltransferase